MEESVAQLLVPPRVDLHAIMMKAQVRNQYVVPHDWNITLRWAGLYIAEHIGLHGAYLCFALVLALYHFYGCHEI